VPQAVAARALLGLLVVVGTITGVTATALLLGAVPSGAQAQAAVSDIARTQVPAPMLELYRQAAATCPGLSWTVLAGVGHVETRHGRNAAVSSAGAMGPMQFMPATWVQYGADASGDGTVDIQDPADAVHSAARMLCANGAADPGRLRGALWAYNHASWYVDMVLAAADLYARTDATPAGPETQALLSAANLVLSDGARTDLEAGHVDGRLLRILADVTQGHSVSVSVFRSGHAPFVEGTTRFSYHLFGRAMDVYAVDGEAVSPTSDAARGLVEWLLSLEGPNRPTEVGHPFPDLERPGSFSDEAHLDHIHVGFGPQS
jgi:hypothetical protein